MSAGEPFRPSPRNPTGWADTLILTLVGIGIAFCALTGVLLRVGVLER